MLRNHSEQIEELNQATNNGFAHQYGTSKILRTFFLHNENWSNVFLLM